MTVRYSQLEALDRTVDVIGRRLNSTKLASGEFEVFVLYGRLYGDQSFYYDLRMREMAVGWRTGAVAKKSACSAIVHAGFPRHHQLRFTTTTDGNLDRQLRCARNQVGFVQGGNETFEGVVRRKLVEDFRLRWRTTGFMLSTALLVSASDSLYSLLG